MLTFCFLCCSFVGSGFFFLTLYGNQQHYNTYRHFVRTKYNCFLLLCSCFHFFLVSICTIHSYVENRQSHIEIDRKKTFSTYLSMLFCSMNLYFLVQGTISLHYILFRFFCSSWIRILLFYTITCWIYRLHFLAKLR